MSPRAERPRRARRRPSPGRGATAPGLELELLGGFSALAGGIALGGFESRKVRALLAYLALRDGQPVARDRLAALFWPDLEPEGARRNLRQALYNLREALGAAGRCLAADGHEIRLSGAEVLVDALRFAEAARVGLAGQGPDSIAALAHALDLYRGELLAGLRVPDAEQYEEWRGREGERLRELAVEAARGALRRTEADGLHETALRFARRLGELEPLSEEACRARMSLLARLGWRAQALAEYAEFAARLERELGVESGEELRSLRAAIFAGDEIPEPGASRPGPAGPVVPLVGRESARRELAAVWSEVRNGEPRLTLVLGGRGTGKSRLVRTFLHEALARGSGVVLFARAQPEEGSALRATLAEAAASLPVEVTQRSRPELALAIAATVVALPEIALRRFDLPRLARGAPGDPIRAVSALLAELTRRPRPSLSGRGAPVVLFVDDLERSPEVLEGLLALWREVRDAPVWIVAAGRSDEIAGDKVDAIRAAVAAAGGRSIELGALDRTDVARAARSLVGEAGAEELAAALFGASAGQPLALAEAVNLLADRGTLREVERGRWILAAPATLAGALPNGAERLIDERLALLPKTSRRLLGLAAVVGERFDTATLLEVDREHPAVLEAALQILVERWMVRPFLRGWTVHRRDRDLAIWYGGARRGPFEFAQRVVRERLYRSVDPDRRRFLHREIATAMAGQADESRHDELARQWLAAGEPGRAIESLGAAARRCRSLGDAEGARARLGVARGLLAELRGRNDVDGGDLARAESTLKGAGGG